jgi:hypothetical protein
MEKKTICNLELNQETADAFKDAVANSYWFEFFVGNGSAIRDRLKHHISFC